MSSTCVCVHPPKLWYLLYVRNITWKVSAYAVIAYNRICLYVIISYLCVTYLIAPPPWLQVSDADIGTNGQVAFSLSADTQGLFSLNIVQALVAELTLSHTPDRETRSSYNFRMFATDRGFPALIGETDITIVVGVSTGSAFVCFQCPFQL